MIRFGWLVGWPYVVPDGLGVNVNFWLPHSHVRRYCPRARVLIGQGAVVVLAWGANVSACK